VKFDVLCIETDPPNRPEGYADRVSAFMASKGYKDHAGQVGRNMCKLCGMTCLRLFALHLLNEAFARAVTTLRSIEHSCFDLGGSKWPTCLY
jgi:hypothetical protein